MDIGIPEFRYRTLSEGVETVIRRMILLGELTPGARINEVQLSEDLQMSRGPVREALRRLQTEGLVVYIPHRGTFVSELTDKDADEVYTLRALLEVGAVKTALHKVTSEHLDSLREIVDGFNRELKDGNVPGIIQCDMDFHHLIVKLADNARLFDMYKTLDTQLGAMFISIQKRSPSRIHQVARLHQELVDALQTGDECVVVQAFEDHYMSARKVLQQMNHQ